MVVEGPSRVSLEEGDGRVVSSLDRERAQVDFIPDGSTLGTSAPPQTVPSQPSEAHVAVAISRPEPLTPT